MLTGNKVIFQTPLYTKEFSAMYVCVVGIKYLIKISGDFCTWLGILVALLIV